MLNILINGNNVTAIVNGDLYCRQDLTKEEIQFLKDLTLEYYSAPSDRLQESIMFILQKGMANKVFEIKTIDNVLKVEEALNSSKINLLKNNVLPEIFTVIDNKVFLKGFESVSMPDNLVAKIVGSITESEDITGYVNFWKLCLLNPNPEARKGLFKYVQKQNLLITPKGYFVCYRKAVKTSQGEISTLQKYCTSEIIRIRQSKMPLSRYTIGEDDMEEFYTLDHRTKKYENWKGKVHGLLSDLAINFIEEKRERFTDNHTRTMNFSLGDVVRLPRASCDENPRMECSRGLHVGTPTYINNNSLGDTFLLVFVNPMHVISVPYNDAHKMRVCEYYVSAILNSIDDVHAIDQSKISIFEDEYSTIELKDFEELLMNKKFDKEFFESDSKTMSAEKKAELETKLISLRSEMKFSNDIISKDISMLEFKKIIQSRNK